MSETYKPRRAHLLSDDGEHLIGRCYFIIGGEMAGGTKVWYRCDKNGETFEHLGWFSMTRAGGKMIAIHEGY